MRGHLQTTIGLTLAILLALAVGVTQAQGPEGTAIAPLGGAPLTESFTYQGQLLEGGVAARGYYDFRITIWDAQTNGTQIASSQAWDSQYVEDGLFSFPIMPGVAMNQVFDGGGRWIQVAVRKTGTTTWTTLPRQPVAAVPYAWGLRPGAVIKGSLNDDVLELINEYSADTLGSALRATGHSPTAPAIYGYHAGDGHAVYGRTAGSYPAVEGRHNGAGTGVFGGVDTFDGIGVIGVQPGYSSLDSPVGWKPGGFFGGRNGVIGVSRHSGGFGIVGYSEVGTESWAGYFRSVEGKGVYVSVPEGNVGIQVAGGTKPAVVRTDDGSRMLYAEESAEVWFSDYGFGQLREGQAAIAIDPTFAQTVNLTEPYHVFLQAYGDAALYVSNRTATGFEVHLREGDASVEFSFRIVARRLGYEEHRLERAPWADNDPNLYPEKQGSGSPMAQEDGPQGGQP